MAPFLLPPRQNHKTENERQQNAESVDTDIRDASLPSRYKKLMRLVRKRIEKREEYGSRGGDMDIAATEKSEEAERENSKYEIFRHMRALSHEELHQGQIPGPEGGLRREEKNDAHPDENGNRIPIPVPHPLSDPIRKKRFHEHARQVSA